ncbi:MAG: hypothetical protein ACREQ5_03965 [Candidatus Dormibacteria bacterium]
MDDNGVGIDDYRQITADLFALEQDPAGIRRFVRKGLDTLEGASLIIRSEANGKQYLHITEWDKRRHLPLCEFHKSQEVVR